MPENANKHRVFAFSRSSAFRCSISHVLAMVFSFNEDAHERRSPNRLCGVYLGGWDRT
jgi:hypothetical protein